MERRGGSSDPFDHLSKLSDGRFLTGPNVERLAYGLLTVHCQSHGFAVVADMVEVVSVSATIV